MGVPDIETVLVGALKADTGIIDGDLVDKVSTKLPDNFTGEGRIQLFLVDSAPVDPGSEAGHRPLVQVNAFGADDVEAFDVANLAYNAIRSLEFTKIGTTVIGAVDTVTGPAWLPDESTDIPRYVMRFGIVARRKAS